MDPGSPLISGHIVTEGQKSGPFGWMGSIMDPFMPSPRQEPWGNVLGGGGVQVGVALSSSKNLPEYWSG